MVKNAWKMFYFCMIVSNKWVVKPRSTCIINLKIFIFHVYFFNMDISIIIALIYLKTCLCIAEICMKGRVSQNFDFGLSFCFMPYRKRNFERKYKNSQRLPVFCHKIKTRA